MGDVSVERRAADALLARGVDEVTGELCAAGVVLARLFDREHPADDGEPVGHDFLTSMGFADRGGAVYALRANEVYVHLWGSLDVGRKEVWYVALDNHTPFITGTVTRGDVRRLLAALGITAPGR